MICEDDHIDVESLKLYPDGLPYTLGMETSEKNRPTSADCLLFLNLPP